MEASPVTVILCVCTCCTYRSGKVVYDSYGDTGITGGCSQRDTESIGYERLETSLCTDLDKGTATVTADLKKEKTQ